MKKTVILILSIFILSAGCKKKEQIEPETPNNAPSPAPTGGIQNGMGSNSNNLQGVMQVTKYTIPSFGASIYQSAAAFNPNPMSFGYYSIMGNIYSTTGVNAGTLKINSTPLVFNGGTPSQQNMYVDTAASPNYGNSVTWNLAANSSFNSFTTTVSRGFPVIANMNYLPASFAKSSPLTINFGANNYSNTDSLIVFISAQSGMSPIKHLSASATSVTYSSGELTGLGTGNGNIIIMAMNFSNISTSGKNYVFIMGNNLSENVVINP
jgi:hypothetical protein